MLSNSSSGCYRASSAHLLPLTLISPVSDSFLPWSSFPAGGATRHVFAQPFAGDEHPPGQLFVSGNSNRSMMRNSEQCLHETVAKRRNLQKISLFDLPMDILSTILLLLPINDATRTSVLSRKLKYVWCSHTNLTFDKATMRKTYFKPSTGYYRFLRDHEFVTRVNTVLRQHSGTGVERMEIKFRLHSWPKVAFFRALAYGKKWIVREEPYNLTSQFFNPSNGSHLQCLELMAVSLHLPSDFKGFLNLKSLSLVDVSITDEDVECMLSKCNLLEFFEISYCRMVTSIRMLHPLNRFKHLVVHICPKLQEIELNCSPTTLKYAGAVVPLIFASTSRLKNIDVVILTDQSALSYIVTGFPSTLPSLETLTLLCYEPERTIVPEGHFKFTYLRNLGLELVMCDYGIRKTDFLDYAYLLKIAPFLETLELHVSLFHCGFQIQICMTILMMEKIPRTKQITRIMIHLIMLPIEHGIARSCHVGPSLHQAQARPRRAQGR